MVWSPPTPPIATNGACHFCGTFAPGPKTSTKSFERNHGGFESDGDVKHPTFKKRRLRTSWRFNMEPNKDGWLEGYEWTLGLWLSSFTLSSNIAIALPNVQEEIHSPKLTWHLPRSILKRKLIFQPKCFSCHLPKCAIFLCLFTRVGDEAVAGFSPMMYRGKPSIAQSRKGTNSRLRSPKLT